MCIGILGCTGYIGRSLASALVREGHSGGILAFSRDPARARVKMDEFRIPESVIPISYDSLWGEACDVLINATGIGSPRVLRAGPRAIYGACESIDQLLVSYLSSYPSCRVFSLSTGAVYGVQMGEPISDAMSVSYDPNRLVNANHYALAKLVSEAKHRAYPEYAITDLRVYAFFSRDVDVGEDFLLSQIAARLRDGQTLETAPGDMTRDFITAHDLLGAIRFLSERPQENAVYDIRSRAIVAKSTLLAHCEREFGLKWSISGSVQDSPTGSKNAYYSINDSLEQIGFISKYDSLGGIDLEMRAFLGI
jgi:nucleoside-diphosphate-sugar epimerase